MKIFVTFSLTLVTLAFADISLHNGYANNGQQQQQQLYSAPQQSQQSQQALLEQVLARLPPAPQQASAPLGSINNPMRITQPSFQYLPTQQQQSLAAQQQYLPPQQQHVSVQQKYQPKQQQLPMPSNYIPPPVPSVGVVKSHRRSRHRKLPKKAVVTKNFFIHSAPEESEEELQEELSQLAEQPRKHYNVLFVKTPTQTNKAAAVNLAKTLKEEKTVVYVLSKKTSAADIQEAIQEAPQQINKPEVFFIKYRTPEEALHAQRQIQSQYDSLGGSSTISDEGVAPVTSVVGSLDEPEEDESEEEEPQLSQEQFTNAVNQLANNQYLPPANKF